MLVGTLGTFWNQPRDGVVDQPFESRVEGTHVELADGRSFDSDGISRSLRRQAKKISKGERQGRLTEEEAQTLRRYRREFNTFMYESMNDGQIDRCERQAINAACIRWTCPSPASGRHADGRLY